MAKSANVGFLVNNQIKFISQPVDGVSFVSGITVRGPFANPKDIINSWPQFVRLFGGMHPEDNFPLHCRRTLEGGGRLRINRLGHYTDIDDASTLDAELAALNAIKVLSIDDALVADNNIALDLEINGAAAITVDETFDTNSDTTLANLAATLQALDSIQSATVVEIAGADDNDRQIVIVTAEDFDVVYSNPIVTLGATQADATLDDRLGVIDSKGNLLFNIKPKYKGADYNHFVLRITPGTNGNSSYFNIELIHTMEPDMSEVYNNLTIPGNPTVANSNYLKDIITQSPTFDVEYEDLSGIDAPIVPITYTANFVGGSDGSAIDTTDKIGSSAGKNGFNAFDDYDDAYQIFIPTADEDEDGLHSAGFAYAENRKDIHYWAHLNHELSKTALIAARDDLNINSKYGAFFSGSQEVIDPRNSSRIVISELSNIAVLAAESDADFGPWYSFAGLTRGRLKNVLGVGGTNYGSPAALDDMHDLANHQINMIVNRDGGTFLWNLYSASLDNDPEQFLNIGRLLLFIKKSLRPTLEQYLEDPNDTQTWKRIYYDVKPFIQTLLDNRAVSRAEWQGDQFASELSDESLQVNTLADVLQGKYKVDFKITPIAPLKEITVTINLIDGVGVTFGDEE